jgi:FG-GAP-like repeat
MVGVPLGSINVFGANFTPDAQVFLDGAALPITFVESSSELSAELQIEIDSSAQVHEVTVHQGSGTSNGVSLTVYAPVLGPQPFQAISGYDPNGSDSSLMTVADVNGDGFADVIMQGPTINGAPSLAVMLGQANGQLGSPTITPGLLAGAMVAGDVNGDGSVDIVSATLNANSSPVISVLLNDGTGNFTQSSTIPFVGDFPGSLTLVDVDGDGQLDLLFSVNDPAAIYYLRNLGRGSFAAPVSLASPAGDNQAFAVGDFNGDGRPDIVYVATNPTTNLDQIHLLLNQGGGSFSDQVPPGISGEAGYFAIGDFNRDGFMDIALEPEPPFVSLSSVAVSVFFGQGNGSFVGGPTTVFENNSFQTYRLIAGDFDGDGNLDLAGVNGDTEPGHVVMLWGNGTGNFSSQRVNGPMGFLLASGDINGDGVPDLIVPDRFGILSVVLGQKQRSIPSAESFTPTNGANVSAGDVNGDGKLDLLVPGSSTPAPGTLYLNQGNGQFEQAGSPSGEGILLADLDGDGLAEMIGSDGTNILIWKGTGDPNFGGAPIEISPPAGVGFAAPQMQIADVDGDGRPDIILPNVILYNQGNLSFLVLPVNFGGINSPFVIANFNHDGLLDIATGGFTLLGEANRTFRTVTPNNLNITAGNFAAVGDFNLDGFPDVVFGGNGSPIVIYYSRGDGTFYEQSLLNVRPISDFSQALAVADFNGDGRPDILACLFLSEQCVVYTNDGRGGFQRSYFASGANSIGVLAADLNGEGKPDVVITNYIVQFRPPNFEVILHK